MNQTVTKEKIQITSAESWVKFVNDNISNITHYNKYVIVGIKARKLYTGYQFKYYHQILAKLEGKYMIIDMEYVKPFQIKTSAYYFVIEESWAALESFEINTLRTIKKMIIGAVPNPQIYLWDTKKLIKSILDPNVINNYHFLFS